MQPPVSRGVTRPGFTLVELLVVIGIVAVLTGILVPVVYRAKAKARQAACMSNVRQIGMSLQMYCQDYDERLPPWAVASAPPTGKVWGPTHNYLLDLVYCSYGYNAMHLNGTPLGSVNEPTATIAFVDTAFSAYESQSWGYFAAFPPSMGGHAMMADRHDGGANVAFLDGHTKWHRKELLLADDSLWDLE